ncbi:MAG: AAA family ATPase [Chloroflexia bacterium]
MVLPQRSPIFIITGTPGAGKSSVASELVRRFPFGLHVPVDDLREWVVSGRADPVPDWTEETSRQFRLARLAAAEVTRIYADAGLAVAIDDVITPSEARVLFEVPLSGYAINKVLLRPSLEVALARNAGRTNKTFDTQALEQTIRRLHGWTSEAIFARAGWMIVDSTHLTLEQTVDEILSRVGEAGD